MEDYEEVRTFLSKIQLLVAILATNSVSVYAVRSEDDSIAVVGEDRFVIEDIEPIEIPGKSPYTPNIPNVSSNYAVGTPNASLSVSNFGAAEYSLQIKVPNGGNLMPQLSLAYSSQNAGYGMAGYGFTVTGFSVITRGGKSLFSNNGSIQGVTYTESDDLFLDGKRLILQSGNACQAGAVYCPEGDPYTTITVYDAYDGLNSQIWFDVKTADGNTYLYGDTEDSRLCFKNKHGQTRIASWYVRRVEDVHGNYMTYSYFVRNLFVYPTSITYGKHVHEDRGVVNLISFDYQEFGENSMVFNIEDQKGKIDNGISCITTSCNGTVFSKYHLTYDTNSDQSATKYARLVSIQEKNGYISQDLPPVHLNWDFLPSPHAESTLVRASTKAGDRLLQEQEKSFFATDLNGDGVSEIIRVSPVKVSVTDDRGRSSWQYYTYVYVSPSDQSSLDDFCYDSPILFSMQPTLSTKDITSVLGGSLAMDLDGDGYNDLLFPFYSQSSGHWKNVDFYLISGRDVVTGIGGVAKSFAISLQTAEQTPLLAAFDMDGDGKDEVICVEQRPLNGLYPACRIKMLAGERLDRADFTLNLPKNPEKMFSGDYNNDGLTDIILLYDGGYKIYFNNGGTPETPKFTESNCKTGATLRDCWRMLQGDFDGDGLIDFVYNVTRESFLWVARNNGDGTFTHTRSDDIGISDQSSKYDDDRFSIQVFDMDFDGRSDVMVCKANYGKKYQDTQTKWLYSNGKTLKLAKSITKKREDDANERFIFLGDFDGDGRLEPANYGSRLDRTDDTFEEHKIYCYLNGANLSTAGKITSIVDGLGNRSLISYTSLTNPQTYTRTRTSSTRYPVNTYTLPLSVVKNVQSDNGVAGMQKTIYNYKDLKIHLTGRGVLGFEGLSKYDVVTKGLTRTNITKWDENRWIPLKTEVSNEIEGKIATSVSTYTLKDVNNTYFAYESAQEITDFDDNVTSIVSNYDAQKGVLLERTVKNDGDNMYKKVFYGSYVKCGNTWLPQGMITMQKHSDDPNVYRTKNLYTYNRSKGFVTSEITNYGTPQEMRTYFAYNDFGDLTSTMSKGSGIPSIQKYYHYDNSSRFVVKTFTKPASAVTTYTHDIFGNVLTESDATDPSNILTTTHTYDGWGRLTSTLSPDGTLTTYRRGWGTCQNKKYYILKSTSGQPWVLTWYDAAGHEVLQETFGANGTYVSKATEYNNNGQISKITNTNGKQVITENLTYDERGRVLTDVFSSGKSVSYRYGNRTVTSINADRRHYWKTDAWGNTLLANDPGGNSIRYTYYSNGKPAKVTTNGATVSMEYDAAGNQISLTDPDAGTSTYEYRGDGKLLKQTDARGIESVNTYDELGRLSQVTIGDQSITHTYGTTGHEKLRLKRKTMGQNSIEYAYDKFGRITCEQRQIGTQTHYFQYAYDAQNRLSKVNYPSGLEVKYLYDDYGFKTQVVAGDEVVYKLEDYNGLVTRTSFMGKLIHTQRRDSKGYERNLRITRGETVLENFDATYDYTTGNLLARSRNGQEETFEYDKLDRLITVKTGGEENMRIDYADNGNILYKTGIGNYTYHKNFQPHAVVEVENTDSNIPSDALETTFNSFGKIQSILKENKYTGNDRVNFIYGPDLERWISIQQSYKYGGDTRIIEHIFYAGNYERWANLTGNKREFHYLDDNVIVVKQGEKFTPYLAFTDNLGSYLSLMDADGNKVFDASYDAWGNQTITTNEIGFYRGYTGHEHLNNFGIINMNGRLYDPQLGRFLSPDNYVQLPDNSQSFNRYSYCLNNPLKYTDPSGELFLFTILNVAKDLFVNTFVKSWSQGFNAWSDGSNWTSTKNAFKIDMGLFKGNFKQIISRFTWEAPQTILGHLVGSIQNTLYGVKSVSYYGGATAIEHYSKGWGGFTLGSFINGQRGLKADPNNSLFQHEYGHYLQSQSAGPFYLQRYAIPSFMDAWVGKGKHSHHATEQDANIRAFKYFMKHVPDFNKTNEKGDFVGSKWYYDKNPIKGYNWSEPFDSPVNQSVLKKGCISLGWADYVFGPSIFIPGIFNVLQLKQ